MNRDPMEKLLTILRLLDEANIAYTLAHYRVDAVSIQAAVPGERWEIDVLEDGTVEFERFLSMGAMADFLDLKKLITLHSDSAPETSKR